MEVEKLINKEEIRIIYVCWSCMRSVEVAGSHAAAIKNTL